MNTLSYAHFRPLNKFSFKGSIAVFSLSSELLRLSKLISFNGSNAFLILFANDDALSSISVVVNIVDTDSPGLDFSVLLLLSFLLNTLTVSNDARLFFALSADFDVLLRLSE